MRRRIERAIFLIAAMVMAWPAESASLLDPALHFRVLATPHFRIYFHQGEAPIAAYLAPIAEDTWEKVGRLVGVTSPKLTHVILADQTELANGWATPIPYNTIFVTAAAPSGSEYIGRERDWLRLVFTHEFTHIVHLDRSEGWSKLFRGLFGRTPIAFPNLWLPTWQVEGYATWAESMLTSQGRLSGGDFRAIVGEAARAHKLEPLDRVNGGLVDWPGGSAPYAYGAPFLAWLEQTRGGTLSDLATATAGTLPFTGSLAFNDVLGESISDLWKEFATSLATSADATPSGWPAPRRLTSHGFWTLGPRFAAPSCSGCRGEIIYSARDPHQLPQLKTVDLDGRSHGLIATRYLGSTIGLSRDWIVFDQQDLRRNVGMYSDLYVRDRRSGATSRLTRDARLQDPDLAADANRIVAVRENAGTRDLVLVHLRARDGEPPAVDRIDTLVHEAGTSFSAPRFSPDGSQVVVERHRLGAYSDLVVFEVTSGAESFQIGIPDARLGTPTWTPDGRSLVFAADIGGPFNLWVVSLADRGMRQVTSLTGGALWPDVSADGSTVVFAGYSADGFDVYTTALANGIAQTMPFSRTTAGPPVALPEPQDLGATYHPAATMRPTTWVPLFSSDASNTTIGAFVSGADVLGRHRYSLSGTWFVRYPAEQRVPSLGLPDWTVSYAYDRWRPTFFTTASSERTFRLATSSAGPAEDITVRETEIQAGVLWPIRHVRSTERVLSSLVRTHDDYFFPEGTDRNRDRNALRFGVSADTAHEFGYSISAERGVNVGATTEIIRRGFGASEDATTTTVDARAYAPGLFRHHVIAVRGAAGTTSGAAGFARIFTLGGGGVGDVLDFDGDALGLLRGFPADTFLGSHITVVNADYRWPIAYPQRGVGTWPIFLQAVHGAVTFDAGHSWDASFTRSAIKTSAGAELSFDTVVGYSFPLSVTGGVSWGRDGATGDHNATAYARIGRAF